MFEDIPVIHRILSYQPQAIWAVPFPVYDILQHCIRIDFDFLSKIEDLEGSLLGFESNDLLVPMHDGTVGLNRPLHDLIVVFEVDYDDLGVGAFRDSLADAYVVVGL